MAGSIYLCVVAACILGLGFRELWINLTLLTQGVKVTGTIIGFETAPTRRRLYCPVIEYSDQGGGKRTFLGRGRSEKDESLIGSPVMLRYLVRGEKITERRWDQATIWIAPCALLAMGGVAVAAAIGRMFKG